MIGFKSSDRIAGSWSPAAKPVTTIRASARTSSSAVPVAPSSSGKEFEPADQPLRLCLAEWRESHHVSRMIST